MQNIIHTRKHPSNTTKCLKRDGCRGDACSWRSGQDWLNSFWDCRLPNNDPGSWAISEKKNTICTRLSESKSLSRLTIIHHYKNLSSTAKCLGLDGSRCSCHWFNGFWGCRLPDNRPRNLSSQYIASV